MKHFMIATAALALMATGASANNCDLTRGTVFSAGPLYGEMVVKCGAKLVGTRADIEAAGVNIWDPKDVLRYAVANNFMAGLPEFGGEGRRPGPDGVLNTPDDVLEGPDNSW